MSSFGYLLKILQKINKMYKPILQSVNMDAFIAARKALTKSEIDIVVLHRKIRREKQLNRQMELNGSVKRLKNELEGLV